MINGHKPSIDQIITYDAYNGYYAEVPYNNDYGLNFGAQNQIELSVTTNATPKCNCNAKFSVLDEFDHLPIVIPRFHGSGCAFEIAVLERHDPTCIYKKCDNPFRDALDDKCGSFDVVGRLVFPYCDRAGGGVKQSDKSYVINQVDAFGQTLCANRSRISTNPILPICDDCVRCCSDSLINCCRLNAQPENQILPRDTTEIDCCGSFNLFGTTLKQSESDCCGKYGTSEFHPVKETDCCGSYSEMGYGLALNTSTDISNTDNKNNQYSCCPPKSNVTRWSELNRLPQLPTSCICTKSENNLGSKLDMCPIIFNESIPQIKELPEFYPIQIHNEDPIKIKLDRLKNCINNDNFMSKFPMEKREHIMKLRKLITDTEPAVKVSKSTKNLYFTQVYQLYPARLASKKPKASTNSSTEILHKSKNKSSIQIAAISSSTKGHSKHSMHSLKKTSSKAVTFTSKNDSDLQVEIKEFELEEKIMIPGSSSIRKEPIVTQAAQDRVRSKFLAFFTGKRKSAFTKSTDDKNHASHHRGSQRHETRKVIEDSKKKFRPQN